MAPPLLLCAFVLAAGGIKAPAPAGPIYSALAGAWVGALEYRDYSSNARVFLPMILDIRRTKGAPSLTLHYIYDDGPTKVVQDTEIVAIDPSAAIYTTISGDGKETTKETIIGLEAFLKSRRGRLVRYGAGKESGKEVEVQTTLTVSPTTLTILRETRPSGGAFQFRDQYTLTRVGPATTGD